MSSDTQPDVKIVGYCRACGKALDEQSVRKSQGTIFCEEHVPQETSYSMPGAGPHTGAAAGAAGSPYGASVPPPMPQSDVSPGLAAVLGLIPGVGAIYNGQYAKGFVHVFILGMLITIANSNVSGLEIMVGFMIPGFWLYMAFEAYHTARRRRAGLVVDEFSSIFPSGNAFPVAPVLLIVLGSLILLENLDLLDIGRILRYWPALMVVLGVYLLMVRGRGRPSGNDGSGGGASGGGNDQ